MKAVGYILFLGELYVLSTQYTHSGSRQGAVYQIVDPERFVVSVFI